MFFNLYIFLNQTFSNEYDFIVIGGGSAGAVVASRLSEINEWNILLLEAGDDETIFSDIPGMVSLLEKTNIDWQYRTVSQSPNACLAFNDNKYLLIIAVGLLHNCVYMI